MDSGYTWAMRQLHVFFFPFSQYSVFFQFFIMNTYDLKYAFKLFKQQTVTEAQQMAAGKARCYSRSRREPSSLRGPGGGGGQRPGRAQVLGSATSALAPQLHELHARTGQGSLSLRASVSSSVKQGQQYHPRDCEMMNERSLVLSLTWSKCLGIEGRVCPVVYVCVGVFSHLVNGSKISFILLKASDQLYRNSVL